MSNINKILVVGCHVSGLGVIRALGGKNLHIVAMTYGKTDFGDVSKFVSEKVNIPHPRKEEEKFIDYLIGNSNKWKEALILDTDDNSAVSISKNKSVLAQYYKISTAPWEILRKFIDKREAFLLAQQSNVPHPKNFLPKTIEDLNKIRNEINYPCILKPVRGHEFFEKFRTKNFEVNNDTELPYKFQRCLVSNQEVMVQEIIPGPDTNIFKLQAYINSKGKISSQFFWNKIRQHPPTFGVGRVGISTEWNEEVEELSERLLLASNYRGYFSIEFRKDPRDNQLKLMEVNVRMPRSNMLATSCGVNFPWIIYKDLIEDKQIEIKNYTTNLYWIELYTDIYNIILNHKKENFTFRDYIRPYFSKRKVFAVFSINDIIPFIKQTYILLTKIFLPKTFIRNAKIIIRHCSKGYVKKNFN